MTIVAAAAPTPSNAAMNWSDPVQRAAYTTCIMQRDFRLCEENPFLVMSRAEAQKQIQRQSNAKPVPSTPAETLQCAKLRNQYEDASKKLALTHAYDTVDDSAVRSTMRNSESSNVIAQARLTFDIMKSAGCKLPAHAPSAERYAANSLSCTVALQRQRTANALARLDDDVSSFETPAECSTNLWRTPAE